MKNQNIKTIFTLLVVSVSFIASFLYKDVIGSQLFDSIFLISLVFFIHMLSHQKNNKYEKSK